MPSTMVLFSADEPTPSSSFDRRFHSKSDAYAKSSAAEYSQFNNSKMSTGRYSFYTPSAVDAATVNKGKSKTRASEPPQLSQNGSIKPKQSEKQAALKQKLTTYARGCDRRQILRLLGSNQYTKMYTLKNAVVEDIAAAEREASAERGVLNGVKFLQVRGSGVGE